MRSASRFACDAAFVASSFFISHAALRRPALPSDAVAVPPGALDPSTALRSSSPDAVDMAHYW